MTTSPFLKLLELFDGLIIMVSHCIVISVSNSFLAENVNTNRHKQRTGETLHKSEYENLFLGLRFLVNHPEFKFMIRDSLCWCLIPY